MSIYAPPPSLPQIAQAVAEYYRVDAEALHDRSRRIHLVRARRMICYLARNRGYTLRETGRWLGRDHSTVRAAIRVMDRLTDEGHEEALDAEEISKALLQRAGDTLPV